MVPAPAPEEDLPPVALEVACQTSTADWQMNLEQLFHNARDRFPDVVWELQSEADKLPSEEVWGHKAMVYARAPPTFQARYFSFRPAPVASPSPYGPSPMPAQSAVSLGLSMSIEAPSPARSPSPNAALRPLSPTPSAAPGQILRLTTTIASALFSQELEYLYTGKSFGDAFEFLFDSPDKRDGGDEEKNRVDKLRKDLVFMWRSRLYSDVRIQLDGNFSSSTSAPDDPTVTPVFSSHRFILVSRSPYFRNVLLGKSFAAPAPLPGQPITLTLPSPPFTPASLHFTLGFIYTGTLAFSHRTFDLDTSFHIMRSASYLSIVSLYDEIEARIIEDMCHGLFMAYTPFAEYEEATGGKWGSKGCKCRQCARRAPRVLEFATLPDVQNDRLANGARRALVGLFGDGWCTPEFATLSAKTREALLKGVNKRTIPLNVFPLLFAAHRALFRLNEGRDKDKDLGDVNKMVEQARKRVGEILCQQAEACFERAEWISLMEADGGRFEDGEKVEWVMDALREGLSEKNAPLVYQTLVSSILLRPHPEDPNQTMLSHTSGIRQQIEVTRLGVAKWIQDRWMNVHAQGGFEDLEGWALKELSHEMEVPLEDLVRPSPLSNSHLSVPSSKFGKPEGDGDTASVTSIRASVMSRASVSDVPADDAASTTSSLAPPAVRTSIASSVRSGISVRSGVSNVRTKPTATRPSALSTSQAGPSPRAPSRASTTTTSRTPRTPSQTAPRIPSIAAQRERTPSMASQASQASIASRSPSQASRVRPPASTTSARKSIASSVASERPKSLAPSVASTIRKVSPSNPATGSSPRAASARKTAAKKQESRPVSTASTKSEASTFKTARSEVESRRSSTASTASNATAGRKRTLSTTSNGSITTTTTTPSPSTAKKVPPVPKRPPSTASVRSAISTVSMTNRKAVGKAAAAKAAEKRASIGKLAIPPLPQQTVPKITTTHAQKDKGKGKAALIEKVSTPSTATSEESTLKAPTVRSTLKRTSNETLTSSIGTSTTSTSTVTATPATPRPSKALPLGLVQATFKLGATLNVGIPCIISSKRSRFRAFARYIGELEGEMGPWVGVEVPVGEAWGPEKLEGRPWNDGSWGGRRYFEIGTNLEWDENEERRKRRKEGSGGMMSTRERTLKREGEQLTVERPKRIRSTSPSVSDVSASESRGLFVRPKDVIYVLDAVTEL